MRMNPITRRYQVWTAFLSGCAGHGYGAQGIWNFYDPDDPLGETGKKLGKPWETAIQYKGPSTIKHAAEMLRSIEWNRLAPKREALHIDGKACPTSNRR